MTAEAAKRGRPTKCTKPIAAKVLRRVAMGESLRQIGADPAMPDRETLRRWIGCDEEFRGRYARAAAARAWLMVDEIIEISDDEERDRYEAKDAQGKAQVVVDRGRVERARLMVDSRKWILSRLLPRTFGDRVQHSGADGGPIGISVERRSARELVEARLAGIAQRLRATPGDPAQGESA